MASESADPKPLDPELEEEFQRLNAKHKAAEPEEAGGFGPDELQGAVEDAAADRKEKVETAAAEEGFALTVQEAGATTAVQLFDSDPMQALTKMRGLVQMMCSLMDECGRDKFVCVIEGKDYPRVEWWTAVGMPLGLFPRTVKTERLDLDPKAGYKGETWKVHAELWHLGSSTKITEVDAVCSMDEGRWRDSYAVLSMAQTRAFGKLYRGPLSGLAVMAGLKPTPAEEMYEGIGGDPKKRKRAKPKAAPRKAADVLKDMEPEAPPAEEPEPPPPEQPAAPDPKGAQLAGWLLKRIEAGKRGYGVVTAIQPEPWERWAGDDRKGLKIKGFRALTDEGKPWPLDFETLSNPNSADKKKQWVVGARVCWRWDTDKRGGPAWRVEVAPDCKTYIARVKEVRPSPIDPEPEPEAKLKLAYAPQAVPAPTHAPPLTADPAPPPAPSVDTDKGRAVDFKAAKTEAEATVKRMQLLMGLKWTADTLADISNAAFGTENYGVVSRATINDYDAVLKFIEGMDFLVQNTPELKTLPRA